MLSYSTKFEDKMYILLHELIVVTFRLCFCEK